VITKERTKKFIKLIYFFQAILGSFHNVAFWPSNAPKAAVPTVPTTQGSVGNSSILPSKRSNPESAPCTPVEQNGSSEIDVKPSLEMLIPGYAACTSAQPNISSEIDIKPSVIVDNSTGGTFASQGDTEVHALDS
jgi:hypothetical protein